MRFVSSLFVGHLTVAATLAAQPPLGAAAPFTLRDVLDSALARHPVIGAAQARVRAAQGMRTTAGAFGNPVIGYEVDDTPFPGGGRLPAGLDREGMATVTLPLEGLYQRAPRMHAADNLVRAAEADVITARQQLALEVSRAYYQTALAQISVVAARDLTGWLDSVVAYDRARVHEGATAEADLIRAELERDRSAADAAMQAADLARARAELAAFVGDSGIASPLVVAVTDAPLVMPGAVSSGNVGIVAQRATPPAPIDSAFAHRSELRASQERLSAAGATVATERGMLIRQLGVTIGAKQTLGTSSLIAGISLPLPLFDQNRGEVARASAEREAASYELAADRRMVRAEVEGAAEAARVLTEQAALLSRGGPDRFLSRADEARRIALGAYREGAVPLIQVLDAARAWSDARVAYYHTLFAQHESVLALLSAEGLDLFTELPRLTGAAADAGAHQ